MKKTILRGSIVCFAVGVCAVAPVQAQSVLASRGLGYPYTPADARAAGLGGTALGLPGVVGSLVNPAEIAWTRVPMLSVAWQSDGYDAEAGDQATDGTTTRFPLIQAVFPVGPRAAASVGFGSFLDQHWQASVSDTVEVGGVRRGVTDRFRSEGGIARLRLAAAYRPVDRVAVGVGADVFTGVVRDTVARLFADETGETGFGADRSHGGVGFSAGVRWNPLDPVIVSASVAGGGEIRAEIEQGGVESSRSYANPLRVDAGASARMGANTVLAASARWAGWSAADDELAGSGGARDVMGATVGVEYAGLTVLRQGIPLRVGARWAQLPFRWGSVATGNDFPDERAATAGLGFRLGGGAALGDVAGEVGRRGSASTGLEEDYWRVTVSLTLLAR